MFINHLRQCLAASLRTLLYNQVTIFYDQKNKYASKNVRARGSSLPFFILAASLSSGFSPEKQGSATDAALLHLWRRVKWVFTARLEGTCSETCGDRR